MTNEYGEFMNSKTFKKASYSNLNHKQKENYNFHRLSSLLASFGFNCIWLNKLLSQEIEIKVGVFFS